MRFIDKPWHQLEQRDAEPHRYKDRDATMTDAIGELCERLGVESFDELWDVLFELDAELDAYLRRAHLLCAQLRAQQPPSPQDIEREAFMARPTTSAYGARAARGSRLMRRPCSTRSSRPCAPQASP